MFSSNASPHGRFRSFLQPARDWVANLLTRRAPAGRPRSFKPSLEELLARIVPAFTNCYWSGDGPNNNASTPMNWIGGIKPVDGTDSAIFLGTAAGANGNKAIVFDADFTASLQDLTFQPAYSGAVELASSLTVGGGVVQSTSLFNLDAATVLTAHNCQSNEGTLLGSGGLAITGTPSDPGNAGFNTTTTQEFATLNVGTNANLLFSTKTTFDSTRITNNGTTTWTGGDVRFVEGVAFTNNPNGTFLDYCDQSWRTGLGGTFVNLGNFTKDHTSGATTFSSNFNNGGPSAQVLVHTGTLELARTGNHTAPFTIDAGATLELGGQKQTLNTGTNFRGAGLVVDALAQLDVPVGASVTFDAALDLPAGGGGALGDVANLGGTIYVTNNFHWASGPLRNLTGVYVSGTLLIDGADEKALTNTFLTSNAQAVWDGTGNIDLTNATFENYGSFEIRNNAKLGDTAPMRDSSFFQNLDGAEGRGSVTKTGPGAGTTFDIRFQTSGDLFFAGNRIEFTQGLSQIANGNTVLAGGTMKIDAGMVYQLGGGTLVGGGTIDGSLTQVGGTVDIGSNPASLTLTVTGNYEQQVGAVLKIDASSDTSWGALNVGGDANLGGTLAIDLLMGYVPNAGLAEKVLNITGTRTGTFPAPAGWTLQANDHDITITKQAAVATTTWLVSSQDPSAPGQAVTFTATVSGGMGVAPTGTVSFYDGATLLGTVSLAPGMMGATASFTTSALALGDHQITAVYSGDATFPGSTSSPLDQRVQQATTMTWASSSQNYSAPGQAVTFTATVYGGMVGSPTGTVSFYDGATLLGTVSLAPGMMGATASFTTSALVLGDHQITAVYSGDLAFAASTSSPLDQMVG